MCAHWPTRKRPAAARLHKPILHWLKSALLHRGVHRVKACGLVASGPQPSQHCRSHPAALWRDPAARALARAHMLTPYHPRRPSQAPDSQAATMSRILSLLLALALSAVAIQAAPTGVFLGVRWNQVGNGYSNARCNSPECYGALKQCAAGWSLAAAAAQLWQHLTCRAAAGRSLALRAVLMRASATRRAAAQCGTRQPRRARSSASCAPTGSC